VFYAFGEPRYLLVMFSVIFCNYVGALLINSSKHPKFWLTATVVANIGFLIYYKYFNFLIENFNLIFSSKIPLLNIALPLGISFYTFQALSYTIDVYRKIVKPQRNFCKLALYISLFPQLIAGPIVKYHDIVDQIEGRKESLDSFYYGLRRFIIGLAKKVLIANTLGAVASSIFSQPVTDVGTSYCWIGALLWTLQVYYDFSGYSDMAVGLGALFGFKFMENFNYPYISRTISEYWRRWHISLGTWCKDYLYIPMGGSRVATWRIYFNLFFLFIVIGMWHGATWNFVFFGLWNALLICFERALKLKDKKFNVFGEIILHAYTICAIFISSIFGCAKDLPQAINCIKNMFFEYKPNDLNYQMPYFFGREEIITLIVAIVFSAPILKNILHLKNNRLNALIDTGLIIVLILSCLKTINSSYNPFIYFRF